MHKVISICFNDDKSITPHCKLLAVRIILKSLTFTWRSPFRTLTIKTFSPRRLIIGPITTLFYADWHTHMKNLTYSSGIITIIFEVLRPSGTVSDFRSRTFVPQYTSGVWIVARHKTSSRWTTISTLTICSGKTSAPFCQAIDIWRLTNRITVTG